jgi:hypothetical protein
MKAQVYNNVYNNYDHIYYRTSTNEYLYNYDVFADFISIDNSTYCVGVSTIPETYFDTTKLSYTYFVKLNQNGDTTQTNKTLFYNNELTTLGDPLHRNGDQLIYFGYTKEFRNSLERTSIIVSMDTNLNITFYDTLFSQENTNITNAGVYSDSSYILLVAFDSDTTYNGFNFDYQMVEMDTNFNILRSTIWGGTEADLLSDFVVLPNGNIILLALTDSYGSYAEDIHLMETDINGNILWDVTFGYPGRDIVTGNGLLYLDSFNHIFISGWTELNTGDMSAWLLKTENNGDLIWEKKFNRGAFFDGFVGIRSSLDNNIILSGSTHDYSDPNSPPFGWLLKLDLEGDIIWERFPSKYNNQYNSDDYINTHKIDQNGNILLCGYVTGAYKEDTVYHANDAWLWKADSCGFTTNNPTEALLVVDSIVGYTVYISNLSQEYCKGTYNISDANGITDSADVYAYSQWTNGSDPFQMQYTFSDTGNYEITLYATGGDSTSSYTVQFSIEDTTSSIANSNIESNLLKIYPNPTQDYFIVECSPRLWRGARGEAKVGIYTTTGQFIYEVDLNTNLYQQRIFVDELANGIYILNFMLDGQSIGNKRLSVVR